MKSKINIYNNNLNIVRLLLSVFVFFAHWNILTNQNMTNTLFHLSGLSVDMFFIISGFLIFWSFDKDQNEKHFYIKRFFRIFPLYGILIFLQTLFFLCYSDGNFYEIVKYFISNILFLNFFSYSVGTTLSHLEIDAINGSLWTLKNEVAFYILIPFIYKAYKRYGSSFLIFIYVASVIYMLAIDYLGISKLLVQFPAQIRLFFTGILLYVFFDKIIKYNNIVVLLVSVVTIMSFYPLEVFRFTIYPFFLGLILIYIAYYLKHISIKYDFSYSLYILHFPVIQLALYFELNPTNPLYSFFILLIVILILSYYSEKYIEKKFVKLGRNIVHKDRNKRKNNATN